MGMHMTDPEPEVSELVFDDEDENTKENKEELKEEAKEIVNEYELLIEEEEEKNIQQEKTECFSFIGGH